MTDLDFERRRFNRLLSSLGLMLPGMPLHAAPRGSARSAIDSHAQPKVLKLTRNDWVPNHARLPTPLYRRVITAAGRDPAASFETVFQDAGRPPQWRAGVYPFHHYHSTAHDVLGFVSGHASLMLGGPNGERVEVSGGDVAVLPTGAGHYCLVHRMISWLWEPIRPINSRTFAAGRRRRKPCSGWIVCRARAATLCWKRLAP